MASRFATSVKDWTMPVLCVSALGMFFVILTTQSVMGMMMLVSYATGGR